MATTFLSRAQTTTRIAALLFDTDQPRIAWGLLSEANQDVAMRRAQRAFDDCHWKGRVVEPDQQTSFPRLVDAVSDSCTTSYGYLDPDPNGDADAQVASLPLAVKDAYAIQCAHEALRARGLDVNSHVEDAARLGVISQSEGGQSLTLNATVATSPFARLCSDAQRLMDGYRVTATSME